MLRRSCLAAVSVAFLAAVSGVHAGTSLPACDDLYDTHLRWVARLQIGYVGQTAVQGDWAWAACDVRGLRAVDLSEPGHPVLRNTWRRYDAVDVVVRDDVAFLLQTRWTGSPHSYLDVLDVGNPRSPRILSEMYLAPRYAYRLELRGDYAYVFMDNGDLTTLDVTDLSTPTQTSTVRLGELGATRDIAFDGSTAYVAAREGGTIVLSLDDPARPRWVRTLPVQATALDAAGGMIFVGTTEGTLDILGPSAPAETPFVSRTTLWPFKGSYRAVDVEVSEGIAFVSLNQLGTCVVDVSDPARPVVLGMMETDWASADIAVNGDHVLVADGTSGLQVWRRGDGTPSIPCGTFGLPQSRTGTTLYYFVPIDESTVWTSGTRVVNDSTSIGITAFVDLSDPMAPTLAGEMEKSFWYGDSRDGLLVGGTESFVTMDVTRPTAPRLLGEIAVAGGVRGDCLLDGNVAWTGFRGYPDGIRAFDVSDPEHPMVRSELPLGPGSVKSLAIRGDRLYVGFTVEYNTGALHVVDISDPMAPALVQTVPVWQRALDVSIDGDRMWIATYVNGVEVRDLSNPDLPTVLARKQMPFWTEGVEANGGVAYVTTGQGGVHIVEATPGGIETRGSLYVPGLNYGGSRVIGSKLVTLFRSGRGWKSGLIVSPLHPGTGRHEEPVRNDVRAVWIDADLDGRPSLRTGGPNPFSGTMRMQLDLPAPSPVRVTVLDAAGRLVHTLAEGPLVAGAHPLIWDGRDTTGRPVASGVYFVRMQSAGERTTRKVTRVR